MELKEYQKTALKQIKNYLQLLDKERLLGNLRHASMDAWSEFGLKKQYQERQNGLGYDLPNFCLKIPTGGGKTFLAVKAIDLINSHFRKKRTGLILWIVPTNQIFIQTIKNLRNREHPYRQHLDIASGGRTLVLEKTDKFSPVDIEENLVVLMLMLPSANRKTKETLRIFKDNGGFQSFFPAEDEIIKQGEVLSKFPNLDFYGKKDGFWQRQIKTSLGNTLRILSPIIILDEGHKAYSEQAQDTLRSFNPSLILELSATPSSLSNVLIDIKGIELSREEMIKLDLHVINKTSPDWKDTLLTSCEKRNLLEEKAKEYEANTNINIRPICLIQAERTGKDQRGGKFIHSEDVRENLIKKIGIPENQVAVTSAELKEIEGIDLLARDCEIRYIITKQALQEGWDCPFAYVLTVLTNPQSKNALTQLVGRILRQPNARKTKIKELDESYVFTFQQKAVLLLQNIKNGFEQEGLGDLASSIIQTEDEEEIESKPKIIEVREKFKKYVDHFYLPMFVIKRDSSWQLVNYEQDILMQINWGNIDLNKLFSIKLDTKENEDIEVSVSLSKDIEKVIENRIIERNAEGGLRLDQNFITRQLLDIVPNPWVAFEISNLVFSKLSETYSTKILTNNLVFIIEELKKTLQEELDRLSKTVFSNLVNKDLLRFMVVSKKTSFELPKKIEVKQKSVTLSKQTGEPLQTSLFDFVPQEDFNEVERDVAWYLEDQEKMFFWYRNRVRDDYSVQGWRKQKIYPDFLFTTNKNGDMSFDKIFLVETKGIHLKDNEDTLYKKSVFDLCNDLAKKKNFGELGFKFKDLPIRYEVVYEDEWKRKLNELISSGV